MAQPTRTDVHVDTPLSNISIAYKNSGYVADSVFPQVPVDKQSDLYYIWTKDFWFRNHVQVRGPGGTYAEGGLELSSTGYSAINKGLSYPLPWETIENQDAAVDIETTGAEWLADQFMLDRELALAAKLFDNLATTSRVTLSGGSQWNDYANSAPITDVDSARETVKKLTGRNPNVALINAEVWNNLKNHPDLIDLFKHTQTGVLTTQLVAQVLNLEKIIVADAIKNIGAEGGSFSGDWIWDDNCLLLWVPPSPGLRIPSFGYTFVWKNRGFVIPIKRVEDKLRTRDVLLGDHAFDQKVVGADLGYEIINAVA